MQVFGSNGSAEGEGEAEAGAWGLDGKFSFVSSLWYFGATKKAEKT